jgi:nucleotide-binding universal stress UspA family protein
MAVVPLATTSGGDATRVPPKRHILLATDLSAVGNAAVPHALALLPEGGLLTLMHVTAFPSMMSDHVRRELGHGSMLSPTERNAISDRLRQLVPADAGDRGIFAQTEVVSAADVGRAISQAAERLSVDAICLASDNRTEVSRTLVGSTTRTVRALTRRPLLVVPAPL